MRNFFRLAFGLRNWLLKKSSRIIYMRIFSFAFGWRIWLLKKSFRIFFVCFWFAILNFFDEKTGVMDWCVVVGSTLRNVAEPLDALVLVRRALESARVILVLTLFWWGTLELHKSPLIHMSDFFFCLICALVRLKMPRVAFVFFLHFWAQRLTLLPSDFAQRDDVASTLVGLRFNDATLIVLDCLLITWYTFYFSF